MTQILNNGWNHWSATVLLMLSALMASPLCARELAVVVPPDDDASTREFLAALSESPQVKEAGLTFKVVRSDALGPPSETGALILQGKFPLALLRTSQIPGYLTEREALRFTSLLSHPLIVRDSSEQFFVEDSVVGDAVKQELGRKGFVVLSFWNMAASSLVVKKPVNTIKDLNGLKVSAPEAQSREVLLALGAAPMPLLAGEVAVAWKQGRVDASETIVERGNNYLQMARGGSLLGSFQHRQGFLVANEAAWVGLRQRERAAIQAAALEATQRVRVTVLRTEAGLPDLAKANGLSYMSFTTMGKEWTAARSTWLKHAGDGGGAALNLLDQVKRAQPPKPAASNPSPRSAAPSRIFFATNRNDEGTVDLSYRFGIDRSSSSLVCGEVTYTPDVKRDFGIAHKGSIAVAGSQVTTGAKPCAALVGVAGRKSSGAVIVFIHGYNNSFDFAVRRAIAFVQDLPVTTPVLVFSWPSQGALSGYLFDIGSVTFTRPFAKDLIDALLGEQGLNTISLLAHSMGGQIAFQALEFAAAAGKPIESVVFVAPDVPRSNFIQGIDLYGKSAKLATLYANEHDRALTASSVINRQTPAGLGGATRLTTRGVETVDVSEVDRQFFEKNHSSGFDEPQVARDVSLLLRQHLKASRRNLPSSTQDGLTYWMIKP